MKEHPTVPLPEEAVTLPENSIWRKLPLIAGVVGVISLIASFGTALYMKMSFFAGYLIAFLYFLSIALGGMFAVLIHFATRAGWSVVIRRLAEFILGTFAAPLGKIRFPLFLILFIPIVIGMSTLYPWIPSHGHKLDHVIQAKVGYLNVTFFLIRAGIYFLVWFLIARFFVGSSIEQDRTGNPELSRKMQFWSPLSIACFALTLTFAAFDWIMSTDPHWFSTIFGVYYFAGSLIAIYSTLLIFVISLRGTGVLKGIVTAEHDQDMGKLLFGFNVFWSYIAFSQFMLIWYSNLPEETLWFKHRWEGGWKYLSLTLVFGHFVIPFFFLMSRHIKRKPFLAFIGAAWILLIHLADLYWLIMPNMYHHAHHMKLPHDHFAMIHLLPLVTSFIGIGGIFFAVVGWRMRSEHLVPSQDPRLAESLSFENV